MASNTPPAGDAATIEDAPPTTNGKSHGIGGIHEHGGSRGVTAFVPTTSKFVPTKSGISSVSEHAALEWAKLEEQPTTIRMGKTVVEDYDEAKEALTVDEKTGRFKTVDIEEIANNAELRLRTVEKAGYMWLQNLRDRFDRVGIPQPTVEVRFSNLSVDAKVLMGSANLPTLPNAVIGYLDGVLGMFGANLTKKQPFPVLKDMSGVVKPGRMTLLLGPPGCGKTTLLLALSGRLKGGVTSTGSITYNGHTFDEFIAQRTASYVSQTDTHIGELTVRETFDFSARIQGSGAREKLLRELLRREKEQKVIPDPAIDAFIKTSALEGTKNHIMTDYILKLLGLDICADTIVGNEMLRGISGGQKKRVTTGEMMVGPMNVHFMDEISTGLDSSTTFEIVQSLQRYCHILETTVCMALLQPAPEVFELFDDICLLSEGHVVYFGPRERVLEFFELCGFKIPGRKGVADFLQEVTSKKDQEQYWARPEPWRFVSVQDFVDKFAKFEVGQLTAATLATPFPKEKSSPHALITERYALKPYEMYKAMWDREIILARRNSFLWIFRGTMCAIVAFITAFLFFRTTLSPTTIGDGQLYLGVLFFSLLFMVFSGLSNIALTVQRLPVFTKQRDNLFYPGWAFALPTTFLELPYAVIETVVWSGIIYYIVGLAPEAAHFFCFILILIMLQSMCTALFRLVGALGRSLVSANTGGTFMFLILLVCGGFILAKPDIKPWWVWAYWISPMTYAQTALAVNEFKAHRWNIPNNSNSTRGGATLGLAVLQQRGIQTDINWVWIGVGVLLAFYFLLNGLLIVAFDNVPGFFKTIGALPEDQVIERRKGSVHDDSKLHKMDTIAEDGSANGQGAVAIEMGSAVTSAPSGEIPTTPKSPGYAIDVAPNPRTLQQRRSKADYTMSFQRSMKSQRSLGQPQRSGLDYRNSFLSADGERRKGMVLPFDPLVMTFSEVNYSVDMPADMRTTLGAEKGAKLQLLHGVSGAFRPGVLTALMGVSGAGKTTLMDVLAGRKTGGYIEGDVRISGHPKVHETFARVSGYVEQFDIHSPQSTVREALIYSAWLRLPEEVDKTTRELFVDEVMELVELTTLRDALVGLPGISGLSVEQRKRLTIAVELVANPSIIFMDEPTSGLDARAAAIVMRTVRNTVDTGRTVVCTIHQPSIDIFEAFDELLLLKRGGHVVYFGPLGRDSALLVDYFRKIEGVPPIKEGYNPSTWMLEVTTPAMEEKIGNFAEIFKKSPLFKQAEELIAAEAVPAEGSEPLKFDRVYARSWPVQFQALLWKFAKTYWRFPEYNAIRYLLTLVMALLIGTNFLNLGSKRKTQQDVLNVMGALFISVIQLGVNNAQNVQPVIAIERAVSYRERPAGMYAPLPYALAAGVVEIPYCLTQTALYTVITYALVNFIWTPAKFFWFFFFMFQTLFLFTYYGIMSIAITPNVQIAQVTSILFYFLWCLFCGFLIPRPAMGGWLVWLYYLDPMAWSLYGVVGSQLGDIDNEFISYADGTTVTIKEFTRSYFGFKHELLGMVVGIMFAFTVVFFLVATWALRYLNFQNR